METKRKVFLNWFVILVALLVFSGMLLFGVYASLSLHGEDVGAYAAEENQVYNFNQFVQDGNFPSNTSLWGRYSPSLISVSFQNSRALCTVSSSVATSDDTSIFNLSFPNVIRSDHKYFFCFTSLLDDTNYNIAFSSISNFRFAFEGFGISRTDFTLSSKTMFNSFFFTVSSNLNNARCYLKFVSNNYSTVPLGFQYSFANCQLFDLTLMYGAGNEPTTIVDFRSTFPSEYYNYTTGTLVAPSYDQGYADGFEYADSTVNTDSVSYGAGYEAGFSWALDRSFTFSDFAMRNEFGYTDGPVTFSDFSSILSGFNYIDTDTSSGSSQLISVGNGYRSFFNFDYSSVFDSDLAFQELVQYNPTFIWNVSYVKLLSSTECIFYNETELSVTNMNFIFRSPGDNSSYISFEIKIDDDVVCTVVMYDISTYFYFPNMWSYNRYYINFNSIRSPEFFGSRFVLGLPNVSTAYNEGYSLGLEYADNRLNESSISYRTGYNRGARDASRYTFYSLIDSVIFSPITMIQRALDFNILGTNMKDFYMSLLGVAVVLFLLRLFLGSKLSGGGE